MPKDVSSLQLALHERAPDTTLTRWLYQELRRAILDRRLLPGTRLPATRDFALQYGVSRGTVVTVFEQLQAEGYLIGRVGAGTRINERLSQDVFRRPAPQPRIRKLPAPIRGLSTSRPAHPFRPYEPALTEFPVQIWARVAGRRLRRASSSLLAGGDPRGYAPLREAIAVYLRFVAWGELLSRLRGDCFRGSAGPGPDRSSADQARRSCLGGGPRLLRRHRRLSPGWREDYSRAGGRRWAFGIARRKVVQAGKSGLFDAGTSVSVGHGNAR